MELWMVRHGETEDNKRHVIQGWLPGQLTELGMKQAQQLGKRLCIERFECLYVSDLKRTVDTARIIYEFFPSESLPKFVEEFRIREKSGGIFEGQGIGSTSAKAKELGIDPRHFQPEGGESWLQVNKRVHSFLEDVIYSHIKIGVMKQSQQENKEEVKDDAKTAEIPKILCVTHGGLITEMLNVLQDLQGKEQTMKDKVKNCAIYVFKVDSGKNGKISIEALIENDQSHLSL